MRAARTLGATLAAFLLCALFPSLNSAAPLDQQSQQALSLVNKGIAAYQEGDYEKAAHYYTLSIQQRAYVRAVANLCNLYLYGQGVPRNSSLAFELCSVAAAENDPHALVMLGEMYFAGEGVDQDREAGLELYRRAADLGHPHAQFYLEKHLSGQEGK